MTDHDAALLALTQAICALSFSEGKAAVQRAYLIVAATRRNQDRKDK